ncbi:MAG: zinc ribbon domain-containing protein [Actinobacteria bacterium]|nr:zinc ribbon domain-containing protein [Actinomycetota bacterium]
MANDAKPKPQKEIGRLKANIKKLEKEKNKLFPDLGKAAYQAFLDGRLQEASLAGTFENLKTLDAQIEQGQVEISRLIAQVEQMKAAAAQPPAAAAACPHCGAPATPGLKFCGSCGKELAPPAPAAAATCAKCGSPAVQGVKFCAQCGTPVAAAPAFTPATAAPTAPAPPPPPAAAAPPQAAAAAPTADTGSGSRKCASCSATVDEVDAEFCGECGSLLP